MAAKQNFLAEHWDLFVALGGILVLVGSVVSFIGDMGEDGSSSAAQFDAQLAAGVKPAHEGVAEVDLSDFKQVLKNIKTPPALDDVNAKAANFLASERRVFCHRADSKKPGDSCGKPIPDGLEKCPLCGAPQLVVKVDVDSDNDGLPNDWEIKYGLNPNVADADIDTDKDGFTNREEYEANTDPTDPKSHPDYLLSLSTSGSLKQTILPFWFAKADPIPGNKYRFTFQKLHAKNAFSSKYTPLAGEPIGTTGWIATNYVKKTERKVIAGSKTGAQREVDVSTVDVYRPADGRKITIKVGDQRIPVETQGTLVYNRGEQKTFVVTKGSVIELNGRKYRVVELKSAADKSAEAIMEDLETKKIKVVRKLD